MKSIFSISICSIRTGKNRLGFESPSFLIPLLHQVQPSCLFEPQALWTVSAQQTDMIYGHSHSLSSVAMAFCLLTRWLDNFAMKVSTKDQKLSCGTVLPLPSVFHDSWQVLGRMDEKAIPCHALTYFFLTSWHFVPPFFHLLLEKMQRKRTKFKTEGKKQSSFCNWSNSQKLLNRG